VVLTEAGRTLVAHAEKVLAELDAAELALRELADLRRGRLRLASFATAAATILPRAIDVFRLRHPGIELSVAQASPAESVAGLREGRLDLALTVDLEEAPEGIEVDHLFGDPVQLALHRDHPMASAPGLRLEDLAGETWIDVPRRTSGGKVLARACERAGFVPRVAFESEDYTVIQELVGVGAGLALLPELALCPPHEAVVLRSLGPDGPRREIQAATRTTPFRSPAAGAMLDVLHELGRPERATAPAPAGGQLSAATPPSR
jgi:DNA-binding transcriptional LysR family regulator